MTSKKKPAKLEYDPPGRYALSRWTPAQRAADYQTTFGGEVQQRVLFDLLHNVCGFGAKPMPKPEAGLTLERLVGRQDVAVELLEILSVSLRDVTETNIRRFQHD